jgi:hypothetical protein
VDSDLDIQPVEPKSKSNELKINYELVDDTDITYTIKLDFNKITTN